MRLINMRIIINNNSMVPIYEQVISQIKSEIISGSLPEGQILPSVRALAAELKISALTVKKAYDLLEAEGFDAAVTGFSAPGDGTITVTLGSTDATSIKRSIIRVSGRIGNPGVSNTHRYLYREITVTLMEKQPLSVTVTATEGKTGVDKAVDFAVELPAGLSASVFPIQLRIEAEQNSLCAYSPDLPASTGPSVFTNKTGENTYFFVYTINFSDYRTLNPITKKYVYHYNYSFTLYTSKQGDNSTEIDIRDLGEKFIPTTVTL